jgi:hypothetical protein
MTDSVLHLIASMGLRAPRVALIIPGWNDWKLMARMGIHAATTMWGGAGNERYPHSAVVSPRVFRF